MRRDGPPDDRSIRSALLDNAMPLIFKVAILGGGAAMIHWAWDMGPAFAVVYLGALAAMLAAAVWHVMRSLTSGPADNSGIDPAPAVLAAPPPEPVAPPAPQPPRDQPSRPREPGADGFAIAYSLAIPALLVLAYQYDWLQGMWSAWLFFLLGIVLFIWIGTVGMILDLLFEAVEKRWPRTKIIRRGLSVIWQLMTIFAQGAHR